MQATAFTVQGNTLLAPAWLQALLQLWLGPRTLTIAVLEGRLARVSAQGQQRLSA